MTLPVAVKGPRWTRKRLVDMLIDCYGPTVRGAVDVVAVAAYLGVSESTVRRWLAGGAAANHRRPVMPRQRIRQLQIGYADVEANDAMQYRYALDAIASARSDGAINPYWQEHGWLGDHSVAVIEMRGRPWHQIAMTKGTSAHPLRRHGTVVDSLVVPTRFHGRALVHLVMLTMRSWRVHPAPHRLSSRGGSTRVWMKDAPGVDLAALSNLVDEIAGEHAEPATVERQ